MKKQKKTFLRNIIALILTSTISLQPVLAQQPTTISKEECEENIKAVVSVTEILIVSECHKVIQKAEEALQAQVNQIVTLQELVDQQDQILNAQSNRISNFEHESKKWYKQPVYIGILGVLAGGLAVTIIWR